MQIIQKMQDDEYDVVCATGAELVKELIKLLERGGLGMDQAPAILAVASAAITKGYGIGPDDFAALVAKAGMMWRVENENGNSGVVFDPPHLREGYVAAERDSSKEN